MKKKLIFSGVVLVVLSSCAAHKDYQGRITKNFTAVAGASGKFKNDSLFRKTTVTLSTYSEFMSIYNLQNKAKPLQNTYNNSFGNYAVVLDTLAKQVQNNNTGYESNYSQSMNYIMNDVKDKFVSPCPTCPEQEYRPLLVDVRVNVKNKNGTDVDGYTMYMEPALTYDQNQRLKFTGLKKGVVPGYYKIWIEKDGNRVKERYEHIKNRLATTVVNFVL